MYILYHLKLTSDGITSPWYFIRITTIGIDISTLISSTSRLVTKTQYNSNKNVLEKKIEDFDKKTNGLVKKTDY